MKYNFFDFFFNFHRALVIFLTLTVNKDSIVYSHDKKKQTLFKKCLFMGYPIKIQSSPYQSQLHN